MIELKFVLDDVKTCVVGSDEDVAEDPDGAHWRGDIHSHEAFVLIIKMV